MKVTFALCAAVFAAWLVAPCTGARAGDDDKPWTLDANNWQEGKDLLPDPVLKHLQKGDYWFKVVPIDRDKFHHNYSKAFWDATEANCHTPPVDRVRRPRGTRARRPHPPGSPRFGSRF